jgi:hypothetical protein
MLDSPPLLNVIKSLIDYGKDGIHPVLVFRFHQAGTQTGQFILIARDAFPQSEVR